MLFAAVTSRILFGFLSDKIGPIQTLILGSSLQAISLSMFLPFNSQLSLYIVAVFFGLSQGGIVPIYTVIISKFLPTNEVAERVGLLIFATIIGMSLGGWLSGEIFDYTNSYKLAFLNGIFWNIINVSIMIYLYFIYIMSDLWKKYLETKDVKYLAEACEKAPFFGQKQMGKEISKILKNLS